MRENASSSSPGQHSAWEFCRTWGRERERCNRLAMRRARRTRPSRRDRQVETREPPQRPREPRVSGVVRCAKNGGVKNVCPKPRKAARAHRNRTRGALRCRPDERARACRRTAWGMHAGRPHVRSRDSSDEKTRHFSGPLTYVTRTLKELWLKARVKVRHAGRFSAPWPHAEWRATSARARPRSSASRARRSRARATLSSRRAAPARGAAPSHCERHTHSAR